FAPGCLDQPRPPELALDVAFIGVLPTGPVKVAAWSPDGTRLAYGVVNPERAAWQGVEVRSLPNFRLEGSWAVPGVFDLTWAPDGGAVLFVFDRGDTSSIGLARLGEANWHDLLPEEKAMLAVSLGKNFVDWLDDKTLAFQVHCGTGCEALYSLDIATGELSPLVNTGDFPDAPYADVFATRYRFSSNRRWLAATSWGTGLPRAMVLEWPGPAKPLDLSELLDTRHTEAQSWTNGSLAFVAYPPGEPDAWPHPPRPDLYLWETDAGTLRHVALGAFRAAFAPAADRLALLFVGEPRVSEKGRIESDGSTPHLGLLSWPEGQLLATHSVSAGDISDVFDLWRLPTPVWSPDGGALAFQPEGGGLALMDREGRVWPILTTESVSWVGWGSEGHLALLVGEQVWLVRPTSTATVTSAPIPTGGQRPLGLAREALIRFFSLLNEGRYAEAVGFYGGGYEILRGWNPTIAPNDYAKLLECGCTINGLQCLKVKEILIEEEVSPVEFRFTVRFMNDDGSLFTRGPCCGATEEEMPPQSEFIYTVRKVGDRFLVMELPVYVP
nr:hypothetical protein [Anaerolineae bacterium]